MTFDKQSNGRRIEVEAKSIRSCSYRIRKLNIGGYSAKPDPDITLKSLKQ